MFRKGIALVVMLLFVGLSIVPSSITKQVFDIGNSISQNLNNDYVNAYWKFDECEGNTAYDSSGHGYDGTIYGATWTGGILGCALDFDGVDDYVDFDNHSVGLGFNKTDDLVFSFYFISSTTHKGMIYSMSTDYGTNPVFHIFLDSNGSIGIEINGTSCGFVLFAPGYYNDYNPHYVEIWYNGTSNKPKVDIYVDEEHVGHAEKYVCAFSNDEFDLVKIGRRSHTQTDYFDGMIDELKIIKYPGGNEQNPPEISGPTIGEPGVEYNFTFVTNDPENDNIWLRINWSGVIYNWSGPYESGEEVIVSCEWSENGTYRIGAQSKDIWGNSTWSYHTIRIGNEAPDAPDIDGETSGKAGKDYEYIFNSTDADGASVMYFIDWGDNNTEWTEYNPSGTDVKVKHTWSEKGDYTITSKAQDIYGAEGPEGTLEVTMPKNQQSQDIWYLELLERFPILQRILDALRLNN